MGGMWISEIIQGASLKNPRPSWRNLCGTHQDSQKDLRGLSEESGRNLCSISEALRCGMLCRILEGLRWKPASISENNLTITGESPRTYFRNLEGISQAYQRSHWGHIWGTSAGSLRAVSGAAEEPRGVSESPRRSLGEFMQGPSGIPATSLRVPLRNLPGGSTESLSNLEAFRGSLRMVCAGSPGDLRLSARTKVHVPIPTPAPARIGADSAVVGPTMVPPY